MNLSSLQKPLLFVVHGLPPQEIGGVELYTHTLSRRLSRERPVALFTHRIAPVTEVCVEDHLRDEIPVREVMTNLNWVHDVRDVYANTYCEKPFVEWIDRVQPEEVCFQHTIRLSTRLIERALRLGIRVRVTLHDFFYLCPRVHRFRSDNEPCYSHRQRLNCLSCLNQWYWKARSGIRGWWDLQKIFRHLKKTLHQVHSLEAPSDFVAQVFDHFGFRCPIEIKPLGLIGQPDDSTVLAFRSLREKHAETERPNGTKFTFGYIGGYMPYKGVELLLDAFSELYRRGHKVHLRLFGVARDHDYIRKLKILSANRQIPSEAIHWGGEFDPRDLPQILSQMDVLIVPSLCEETYSFAAREALAYGLPVIGANAGALPEALKDQKDCNLFERGSLQDLVNVMESYASGV